jgi:hypothetical protein
MQNHLSFSSFRFVLSCTNFLLIWIIQIAYFKILLLNLFYYKLFNINIAPQTRRTEGSFSISFVKSGFVVHKKLYTFVVMIFNKDTMKKLPVTLQINAIKLNPKNPFLWASRLALSYLLR